MTNKRMRNIISLLKLLSKKINKTIAICGAFIVCLQKFKKYENDVSAIVI